MESYKRACAEGIAPQYQGNIMAVGKAAAGKTSIKKRLMGEKIDLQHLITNALDTDVCDIDIEHMNQAWSKPGKDRKEMLEEEITDKVRKDMESRRPLPKTPSGKDKGEFNEHNETTSIGEEDVYEEINEPENDDSYYEMIESPNEEIHTPLQNFTHGEQSQIPHTDNAYYFDARRQSSKDDHSHDGEEYVNEENKTQLQVEDISRLEAIAQSKAESSNADHSLIKFWDFAGQKVYYILHTVFLRVTCVYILVLDLSLDMANTRHLSFISGAEFDGFEYWLNTILSHHRKQDKDEAVQKNVVVVGTHLDKLHPDKKEQKRLAERHFDELKSRLKTKQHRNLVISFVAVDNVRGSKGEYAKLRETLLDAVRCNCSWGEKRPIRWLQMTKALHLMLEDQNLSQIERNLVSFEKVMGVASQYNLNTEEDVKVYLRFSHMVGDITYFDIQGLNDYIIPNPQWLSNVFRAIITVDQHYPTDSLPRNEMDMLVRLNTEGLLERRGELLSYLWKPYLKDSNEASDDCSSLDDLDDTMYDISLYRPRIHYVNSNDEARIHYVNSSDEESSMADDTSNDFYDCVSSISTAASANDTTGDYYEHGSIQSRMSAAESTSKAENKEIIEFLLKLMIQFDLIVPLTDEWYLVPCLLPMSQGRSSVSFWGMKPVQPSLYLRFHSSTESYRNFKASCPTRDEFLPIGFFHRLISRCAKLGWAWEDEKCQDVAYFFVDNCKIELGTKSTMVKIDAWFPDTCQQVSPYKYFKEIKSEINALIYAYTPNMWVEYCVKVNSYGEVKFA